MHNDLGCTYPTTTIIIPIIRNNSPVIRTLSVLDVDCGCCDVTEKAKEKAKLSCTDICSFYCGNPLLLLQLDKFDLH